MSSTTMVLLILALGAAVPYMEAIELYEVAIINGLSANRSLFVHCTKHHKSKDLGEFMVPAGSNFSWTFNMNLYLSTQYQCYLAPNSTDTHADFYVWDYKKIGLMNKCDHKACVWTAQDDGVYLNNIVDKEIELCYKWDAGTVGSSVDVCNLF